MNFRQDINGLRAIAVLVVVLFHFKIPPFEGGFAGVDIFFVISGYLMTGIIFRRIDKGSFSVIDFLSDRVRRIVPALATLVGVLLLVGSIILIPSEYEQLAKHSIGALSFISNVMFWQEAGYFDTASNSKWLLHTWSLSAEWQFYVIYPIFIAVVARFLPLSKLRWIILALFTISLALSAILSIKAPSAAFYLLPTRAWEMLLGGLAFLFPINFLKKHSLFWESLGLGLVALSVIFFTEKLTWPGTWATIPAAGAFIIIALSSGRPIFLGFRPLQFIGDISYSVYLWHWPLAVAMYYYSLESFISAKITLVLASIVLGYLSYRFVETPTRSKHQNRRFSSYIVWGTPSVFMLAFAIFMLKGLPARTNAETNYIDTVAREGNPDRNRCFLQNGSTPLSCVFGKHDSISKVTLLGDSHSLAVLTGLSELASAKGFKLEYQGYSACPPIQGIHNKSRPGCYPYNEEILARIDDPKNDNSVVVVVLRTPNFMRNTGDENSGSFYFTDRLGDKPIAEAYTTQYISTMCRMSQRKKLFIMLPIPEMPYNVPDIMARRLMTDPMSEEISISHEAYLKDNSAAIKLANQAAATCNAKLIDPSTILCDKAICKGSLDQIPLYYDSHHLNEIGSKKLKPVFEPIFR